MTSSSAVQDVESVKLVTATRFSSLCPLPFVWESDWCRFIATAGTVKEPHAATLR